jgi:hypothetical protein
LFFRPHDVALADQAGDGLPVTVTLIHPRSGVRHAEALLAGNAAPLEFAVPAGLPLAAGDTLWIRPTRARLFPA